MTGKENHDCDRDYSNLVSINMTPKYQNKRIAIVIICAIFLFLGMWLLLNALNRNTQFFYNPSEITMPGFEAKSDQIRVVGWC